MTWNPARVARLAHRWIALVVGLQLLVWTGSGLYMSAVKLDFIHGDGLVHRLTPPIPAEAVRVSPDDLRARYPGLRGLTLRTLADGTPVYEIASEAGTVLVDATQGDVLSPLPASRIASLARAYYAGRGAVARVQLLERDAPQELSGRPLPVWRVDFDDWLDSSLYLDPDRGRLVVRRHRFWRWFDVLWSLHIMDYRARSDVNNALLRTATLVAVTLAASGLWLVLYSIRGRRRRPASS